MNGGDDGELPPTVCERLATLKARGCNLLVTGAVAPEVTFHASRTLLGTGGARERVLVCLDLEPDADHYLRAGYATEPTSITVRNGFQRSVSGSSTSTPSDDETLLDHRLHPLQSRICESIADSDERRDDLEPAQLRLGVLTLRPIIEEFDRYDVVRFVRIVANLVEGVGGMAHYHLPIEDDDRLVEEYAGLFDGRIELRQRGRLPAEMRWHLHDVGRTTGWFQL
ncbi:DUF7504 family protein [Salinilacihabitans rarus]|uniref:DUF7504 family protein n=1 Tax=Salinilacihabitans rarus TaxID=2961596 RepID=UPI0020C85BF4|nr:hypothetical protein [Salinilacihabitans rarus]